MPIYRMLVVVLLTLGSTKGISQLGNYSLSENRKHLSYIPDSILGNIDSLKWLIYTLNFERRVTPIQGEGHFSVSVLECELRYSAKDTSIKDTAIFYFTPFKIEEERDYLPVREFLDIGYSFKTNSYFPVLNIGALVSTEKNKSYETYFQRVEKEFIRVLKNYKGNLSVWLKEEAIRRKILKK